ncbi:flagellar hook-basal body complex protein FliE [archaeon]|jgi:dephospho-CoA kinase|nr:flagellar hook-basal body complex protein FliE [archaeon]
MSVSVKKLILITGMSGSGKTTLADMFREDGFSVLTMGDVIRGLAAERGLEPTPEVLGSISKGIREELGDTAVAVKCVERLRGVEEHVVVIDGIRSLAEVDVFRGSFQGILVAVHASPEMRYERLRGRGRSDDPQDFSTFRERDLRELGFSLGWAISLADHMIINEGTLENFGELYKGLLGRLEVG